MRPKTDKEIDAMRHGGKALAGILQTLGKEVAPGVRGKDISIRARELIQSAGLQAVLLGYEGYPDVICISVNDGVVHGIPSKQPFKDGDIVKLDLAVAYKSMIVDSAITVLASNQPPSADIKRLLEGAHRALLAGIDSVKGSGTRMGDVGAAIQDVLNKNQLGIVRDLVGHGVGYSVHEDPNVPNYGTRGTGPTLIPGLTIAIEPMATLGDWRVDLLKDGWTVVTRDGSLAAHFEHTVLVTEDGVEILTSL